jgi:hypothetical protein
MTRPTPVGDGFSRKPGLRVVLCKEFWLAFCRTRRLGFEGFGDPCMQLLPGIAQQAAVSRVLH